MGNGERDRGWTRTFVVSPFFGRFRGISKCPQRLGWKTREKARAFKMEPATGKRRAGKPERAAIKMDLRCLGLATQTAEHSVAAPPHSRERECGRVTPEDARSQDGKNWHVLVTSVHMGSCAGLHPFEDVVFRPDDR